MHLSEDNAQLVVGTNFGFRVYDPSTFEIKIINENPDFILFSGIRLAIPYFNTNVFGLVSLLDTEKTSQKSVLLYDEEEKKVTSSFTISSKQNITSINFFKGKLMMCGYDSIEIVSLADHELLHYLKTSGDVSKSLAFHINQNEVLLGFRSLNKDSVIIYNIENFQESQISGFDKDTIQTLSFNKNGDKIAIANKKGDYIQVKSVKTGELLDLFYRGMKSADLMSLMFSPNDKYLSVFSNRYNQHIFELSDYTQKELNWDQYFWRKFSSFSNYMKSKVSLAVHHIGNLNLSYTISDQWVKATPIIRFMTHRVVLRKRVDIYENELNQILDDGSTYQISFDLKNGGQCSCLTPKKNWFKNDYLYMGNLDFFENFGEKHTANTDQTKNDFEGLMMSKILDGETGLDISNKNKYSETTYENKDDWYML